MDARQALDGYAIPADGGEWLPLIVRRVNHRGEPTVIDVSFPGSAAEQAPDTLPAGWV